MLKLHRLLSGFSWFFLWGLHVSRCSTNPIEPLCPDTVLLDSGYEDFPCVDTWTAYLHTWAKRLHEKACLKIHLWPKAELFFAVYHHCSVLVVISIDVWQLFSNCKMRPLSYMYIFIKSIPKTIWAASRVFWFIFFVILQSNTKTVNNLPPIIVPCFLGCFLTGPPNPNYTKAKITKRRQKWVKSCSEHPHW